jgi:L-ascorbate metabolism protein UlaG (beta-lactamase superfamily)
VPLPADLPAPDAVLLSHAHRDHFDVPTLRSLSKSAVAVVPRGLGRRFQRLGFTTVAEVVAGDDVDVGGVSIGVTPADHAPGRGIRQTGPAPVGYLVRGALTTYFAGDTDLFDEMSVLAGVADLALLPVSGWGPRVPAGHMDALRAAEAVERLAPRVAVPIHWGTFRPLYRREPYAEDVAAPLLFARRVRELAPSVEVRVLAAGESFVLAAPANGASSDPDDASRVA